MTTKIKFDNLNYIKLKYEACCFTPDQNTRLEMKTCFFNINREVATTILRYFVLVPENIVRLCCGLGLFSHTVKQVLHFRHLHAIVI